MNKLPTNFKQLCLERTAAHAGTRLAKCAHFVSAVSNLQIATVEPSMSKQFGVGCAIKELEAICFIML